jgi:hypothetical protein
MGFIFYTINQLMFVAQLQSFLQENGKKGFSPKQRSPSSV